MRWENNISKKKSNLNSGVFLGLMKDMKLKCLLIEYVVSDIPFLIFDFYDSSSDRRRVGNPLLWNDPRPRECNFAIAK